MQTTTVVLGVLAALLHAIGYVLYNIQTKKGQSKPNVVSWSIWTFTSVLNAFSYREASGDWVVSLQSFTGSVFCVVTFLMTLGCGKFSWPTWKEWSVFGLGIAATLVWIALKSAAGAQVILIVAFLISFWPTLKGVIEDPAKETSLSWWVWTAAFAVSVVTVIARWEGRPIALLMPVILVFAHGSVACLASSARKDRFATFMPEKS